MIRLAFIYKGDILQGIQKSALVFLLRIIIRKIFIPLTEDLIVFC